MSDQKLACLQHDSDFIPCQVDDGDEIFPNGIFEFNISRLIEGLDDAGIPLSQLQFSELFSRNTTSLDEAHIDSVDLEKPVILAEIAPGRYNIIDGNHRVEKAKRAGLTQLPCYRLSAAQHISYLTSRRAYDAYVDYWNDKVLELM